MTEYLGPLGLFLLLPIGVALLWALGLAYRGRGGGADDAIRLILTIGGWLLIVVGLLGATTAAGLFLSPVGWIVVLAVLVMAVTRYRSLERRSLLWCLSLAARKGVPIEEAARAFANERADELGIRTARLADLLESGVPLTEALRATRMRLPTDALVAVRVGCATGQLAPALAEVAKTDEGLDTAFRSVFEKLFYLGLVLTVLVGILTFMMIKIVPVFAKMFAEFEMDLPRMTQLVVLVSDYFVGYWFLVAPLELAFLLFCCVGGLYYVGWLPRDVPGLDWLSLRIDGALVLRALALAVRQRVPLDRMLEVLSQAYPRWSVRMRLLRARRRIEDGRNWCDSLRAVRLIRSADAALLQSAERVGNLDWAMEEVAESSMRRFAYRMKIWHNILFPIVLIVFGCVVMFFVVGLFMPLVKLIAGLV